MQTLRQRLGIWLFAFGYFACYVPYSAVAKGLSGGLLPGFVDGVDGMAMLPAIATTALVGLIGVTTLFGWWSDLERRSVLGFSIPVPSNVTMLSGFAAAVTGITTTLAYTLEGVSIVFMMLLMRGGVLLMAPLIDLITKMRIRWWSLAALLCCVSALLAAFMGRKAYTISAIALVDVALYLAAYFFRLQWMTKAGKVEGLRGRRRYFVEEQLVSSALIVLALGALAVFGPGEMSNQLAKGFTFIAFDARFFYLATIGLAALGTGVFGALVLLDPRENSFAVPVNRSSSIISGMVATLMLAFFAGQRMPTQAEWTGFSLILIAILLLTLPLWRKDATQ